MAKNLENNNLDDMVWDDDLDLDIDIDDLDLDDLDIDDVVLEDEVEEEKEEVDEVEEEEEKEEVDEVEEEEEDNELEDDIELDDEIIFDDDIEDIELVDIDDIDDEEEEIVEKPKAKKETIKKEVAKKESPKKEVAKKETKTTKKEVAKKESPKKEVAKKETKTTTKKEVKPKSKSSKTVDVYPEQKKAKKTTVSKNQSTYQDMLDKIKREKVDEYNKKMEKIKNGDRSVIPNNKRIGRIEFARLLRLKMAESEEMSTILGNIFKRSLDLTPEQRKVLKLSPQQEEFFKENAKFNLAQTEKLVKNIFIDTIYDLIKIESGIDLIVEDDCRFSFSGELQEEKIYHNSKLIASGKDLTDSVTLVGKHYKVSTTSKAPECVKQKGKLINDKFVADEEK